MAMWHILLPIQISGKHIVIVMSTPSNIISCSIILTNRTLLFGASPLCNVNIAVCWDLLYGVGVGGLLIISNAGYAELNWEKSPVYNYKRVSFPLGGWAVDIVLFLFYCSI